MVTLEDRIKMILGDNIIAREALQLRIAELERLLAEREGPHEVAPPRKADVP